MRYFMKMIFMIAPCMVWFRFIDGLTVGLDGSARTVYYAAGFIAWFPLCSKIIDWFDAEWEEQSKLWAGDKPEEKRCFWGKTENEFFPYLTECGYGEMGATPHKYCHNCGEIVTVERSEYE